MILHIRLTNSFGHFISMTSFQLFMIIGLGLFFSEIALRKCEKNMIY